MKQIIDHIVLFASLLTNIIGILVWYNTSQKKKFAAEQDFKSIKDTNREILRILESSRQGQIEVAQQIRDKLDITLNSFTRESNIAQNTIVGNLKELEMIINVLIIKLTDSSISDIIKGKNKQ